MDNVFTDNLAAQKLKKNTVRFRIHLRYSYVELARALVYE